MTAHRLGSASVMSHANRRENTNAAAAWAYNSFRAIRGIICNMKKPIWRWNWWGRMVRGSLSQQTPAGRHRKCWSLTFVEHFRSQSGYVLFVSDSFGSERPLCWATAISIYFGKYQTTPRWALIESDILAVPDTFSAVYFSMKANPEPFLLFRFGSGV